MTDVNDTVANYSADPLAQQLGAEVLFPNQANHWVDQFGVVNSVFNGATSIDSLTLTDTIAVAGTATFSGSVVVSPAAASFRMGDGTGSPNFELRKVGSGAAAIRFAVGATLSYRWLLDSNEDVRFEHYNPGLANTTIHRADGDWEFPAEVRVGGDLDHDGTNVGFYGTAPVAQSAAYTPTNVTTDRSFDANSTSTAELADVLGTLIADLQAMGLIG